MKFFIPYSMIFSLLFISTELTGQVEYETDSIYYEADTLQGPRSSIFSGKPGRAALYSLILPGAGQVYNGRWWKVPLVYAAIGGMGAVVIYNRNNYKEFKQAYIDRVDGVADPPWPQYDLNGLRVIRDGYRKNLELSYLGLAFVWILNSAEAYVDAHLKEFDINEDISMRVTPKIDYSPYGSEIYGISFSFRPKNKNGLH